MTEPWAGDPRIKELEWVLNRAEEIIRDEYGKNAAYAFVEAWGQLPKELQTPIEPIIADTEGDASPALRCEGHTFEFLHSNRPNRCGYCGRALPDPPAQP